MFLSIYKRKPMGSSESQALRKPGGGSETLEERKPRTVNEPKMNIKPML